MERNEDLENVPHWQNAYFDTGEGGSISPVQKSRCWQQLLLQRS